MPDAVLEARQLAQRAEEFHRITGREEAVVLAEASLLMDPHQPRMHMIAAAVLADTAQREEFWQ